MSICLKALLPDTPGALIKMLKPISDNTGNIYSVIHSHGEKHGSKVPVIVKFDLPPESQEIKLKKIISELEQLQVEITEVETTPKLERIIAIVSGHVFQTDFVDTMKRISRTGARVVSTYAKFKDVASISNVKFEIMCDYDHVENALMELRRICEEKNLFLILDR